MIQHILIIPKIQIAEANAFSSPFTVGFPAMTAWLGAVHALERKFATSEFSNFKVNGVGVVSHDFDLRAKKSESGYITSIIGERHPLKKDGTSPSFVEEPKCHLTASLVISHNGIDPDLTEEFINTLTNTLHKMRIAGGIIRTFRKPQLLKIDPHSDSHTKELKRVFSLLMPGYALVERRDLMLEAMESGKDALQALIEGVSVTYKCESDPPSEDEANQKVEWGKGKRKYPGWIVPIATGFQGLTEPEIALNQRDPDTLHRFAEALVTLGEFKMPHRFNSINELLWSYNYDAENNLYTCQQTTN